jgi:hypothetical protein
MRYKKFTLWAVLALLFFVVLNVAIWKGYTEDLLTEHHYNGGDLTRLGYISGSKHFRKNIVDLPRHHLRIKDYRGGTIDVATLGDSFSNGGAGGRNPFYQDYIASLHNLEVVQLDRFKDMDPLSAVSLMLNSGYLERLRPRYLLLGISEKACLDFAGPVDFAKTISREEMRKLKVVDYFAKRPDLGFINDGNFKFAVSSLLRPFMNRSLFGGVHMQQLREPLFTVQESSRLLFLRYKRLMSRDEIAKINDNLNTLADRLQARGTRLVFMPCADKYTLYSEFISNNPYAKSMFFEELRKLPKRYTFVDTKAILLDAVRSGEKDIYYADDTHWSWKASELIFSKVRFDR